MLGIKADDGRAAGGQAAGGIHMFLSTAGGRAAGGIHMFLSACFSIFVYHTETYAMNILSARVFSFSQKYRNK